MGKERAGEKAIKFPTLHNTFQWSTKRQLVISSTWYGKWKIQATLTLTTNNALIKQRLSIMFITNSRNNHITIISEHLLFNACFLCEVEYFRVTVKLSS